MQDEYMRRTFGVEKGDDVYVCSCIGGGHPPLGLLFFIAFIDYKSNVLITINFQTMKICKIKSARILAMWNLDSNPYFLYIHVYYILPQKQDPVRHDGTHL